MRNQNDYDHIFKVVLIGNKSVGKSSLIQRLTQNTFSEELQGTIGVDFMHKTFELQNKIVKLQIWDTAGEERYRTLTTSYYKGAHGIIIVYDITDNQTFRDVENWLEEVEKYSNENVFKLLIGNKCDLNSIRQVEYEEGKEFADQLGIKFNEASAKDSINVEQSFSTMANEILIDKIQNTDNQKQQTISLDSRQAEDIQRGKRCCF